LRVVFPFATRFQLLPIFRCSSTGRLTLVERCPLTLNFVPRIGYPGEAAGAAGAEVVAACETVAALGAPANNPITNASDAAKAHNRRTVTPPWVSDPMGEGTATGLIQAFRCYWQKYPVGGQKRLGVVLIAGMVAINPSCYS